MARALSTSFIAALPEEGQRQVEAELRGVCEPLGDDLQFPYGSELQAWRRRSLPVGGG